MYSNPFCVKLFYPDSLLVYFFLVTDTSHLPVCSLPPPYQSRIYSANNPPVFRVYSASRIQKPRNAMEKRSD